MKLTLELPRHARANVWLDDAPRATYAATSYLGRTLAPIRTIEPARRLAAIELFVPHGPSLSYALLGAELVMAESTDLEVSVSVSKEGPPLISPLTGKLDRVSIGLPKEFAQAVLDGASRTAQELGAPTQRKLLYRWAAHGFVSSSPTVFENASAMVLRFLTLTENDLEAQICRILSS